MDGTNTGKVQVVSEKVVSIRKGRGQKQPIMNPPVILQPPMIRTVEKIEKVEPKQKTEVSDIQIMTVALTLCKALSLRMAVFLSLIGSFVITMMAVLNPETPRLVATAIYDLLVFLPLLIYGRGK